jgi:hypothetical protein
MLLNEAPVPIATPLNLRPPLPNSIPTVPGPDARMVILLVLTDDDDDEEAAEAL